MGDFERYLYSEQFADVYFSTRNDERIPAHRVILGSRCLFFRALFESKSPSSSSSSIPTIPLPEVDASTFRCVLQFLYTSQCSLALDNVVSVFGLAVSFGLSELQTHCVDFLASCMPLEQVWQVLDETIKIQGADSMLAQLCSRTISRRLDVMCRGDASEKLRLLESSRVRMAERKKASIATNGGSSIPIQFLLREASPRDVGIQEKLLHDGDDVGSPVEDEMNPPTLTIGNTAEGLGLVFLHCMTSVTRMMQAERSALFLYDASREELFSKVAVGSQEQRIPRMRGGLIGSCFESGEIVLCEDVYENGKFDPVIEELPNFRTKSVLLVPVMVQSTGHAAGVVALRNKSSGAPFDEQDSKQVQGFVTVLAGVIRQVLRDRSTLLMDKVFLVPRLILQDGQQAEESGAKPLVRRRPLAKLPKEFLCETTVAKLHQQASQVPQLNVAAPRPDTDSVTHDSSDDEDRRRKRFRKRAANINNGFSHFRIPRFDMSKPPARNAMQNALLESAQNPRP